MDDLTPQSACRASSPGMSGTGSAQGPTRMEISELQRLIWMAYRLAPEDPSYNMVLGGQLADDVDPPALAAAFRAVIREHEALHAAYKEDEAGRVHMICNPDFEPDVTITAKLPMPEEERRHWLECAVDEPFALGAGNCCRVRILVEDGAAGLPPQRHITAVVHHIAGDFASVEMLCERAFARYEAQHAGNPMPLNERGKYWRWIERQRAAERSPCRIKQEDFWRGYLSEAGGPPALFHDPLQDATLATAGETDIALDPGLTEKVRETATQIGVGLFPLLTAAYQLFLYRWSGQDRFLIGTPVSGRSGAAERDMIGYTLNSLPWTADFTGNPSGADLARAAHRNLMAMLRNRQLPSSRIATLSGEDRLKLRHMTTFVQIGERKAIRRIMPVEMFANQRGAAQEINLRWVDHGHSLVGQWRHDPRCFSPQTAERMRAGLLYALTQIVDAPHLPIGALPVDPADQSKLTAGPVLADQPTALGQFEAMAGRRPEQVAVNDRFRRMTYRELNEQASRLALKLSAAGCRPGDVFAIHLPRSVAMAVAMVAAWKAGGAFLCLDPAQSAARKAMLATHARATAVIGQGPIAPSGMESMTWIDISAAPPSLPCPPSPSSGPARPESGAYVIYTSGSTGKPKAVSVTQGNLLHYVTGLLDRLRPVAPARFATLASPAADLGFTAWFGALLGGHTLHILDDALADDPAALADHLGKHPVDMLKIVPSHLAALMAVPNPARLLPRQWLVLGGEAPGASLLGEVRRLAPVCRILNHYGPTETTVGCLAGEITDCQGAAIPLGTPLPGNHVAIVDAHMRPVPIGVAGELVIGGGGVSAGYLENPAATAERFLPDPTSSGCRLYRSGDRARLTPDGKLAFLGRADDQVKIRGFRVEPGEAQAWLRRQPGVREASVIARPSGGTDGKGPLRLIGFVTPLGLDTTGILAAMANELPDPLVVSHLAALHELPRLPNGKIDRKALPDPVVEAGKQRAAQSLSPLESQIAELWRETLGIDAVGPEDDFFAIGGDSILALQIIAKARPAGLALTPRLFFDKRTLRAITASLALEVTPAPFPDTPAEEVISAAPFSLAGVGDTDIAALKAEGMEDAYPLTPLQEGLLFHSLLEPGGGSYINQLVLDLEGPFEADHFVAAWCETIASHDIMQTSFRWEGRDTPLQMVHPTSADALRCGDAVHILDWRDRSEADRQNGLEEHLQEDRRTGFALDVSPLTRLIVIRMAENRWTLVWTRHHLIVDGWCSILLLDEMLERYRARLACMVPLLTERRPFRDHLAWLANRDRDASAAYWKGTLDGLDDPGLSITPPVNSATQDEGRPYVTREIVLDRTETAKLIEAAQRHKVTLNTLAQGAWALTLAAYTGRRDVIFGVTSAGRPTDLPGADAMIGPFINTLPLRVRLDSAAEGSGTPSLQTYLTVVQSNSVAMRDHEHMPLVDIGRIDPRAVQFDTILVFQNLPNLEGRSRQVGALSLRQRDNVERTHYALTIEVFPGETLSIAVDAKGWEDEALERLIEGFKTALLAMTNDSATPVDAILPIGETETRLLEDWSSNPPSYDIQAGWVERVATNVDAHPDRIAVRHEERSLTYREMWHRSAIFARGLIAAGARPDEPIALLLPRGLDLFCLMVATLRAGCAWMPLDPGHPAARWEKVLARAGQPLVVSSSDIAFPGSSLTLKELTAKGESTDVPIDQPTRGDQLAYVLFTSGSTGEPKGAMVTRDGMLNNMLAKIDPLGLGADDVIAQTAPSCFDISVWQTLMAPLIGARTEIIPDDVVRDPDGLIAVLERSGTTIFEPVPSLMRALVEASNPGGSLARMRWTLPTGEALSSTDAQRWFAAFPHCRLMNAYGPAECADDVAFHAIESIGAIRHPVPIGRPTQGAVLRVMNDTLRPVPIGVTGEIVVSGIGVGRGYVGNQRLTAASFLPDPDGPPGSRLYRTGDLGRWTSDGVIEWAGRRDFQIKVRGHRIEAGEIETWLERHDLVNHAFAMAHDDGLAVWWQPAVTIAGEDAQNEATTKLKAYLAALLPPYMVPDFWVMLPDWPLNDNGKLDHKALPAPRVTSGRAGAEPPATPTEHLLSCHWQELLEKDVTDREANFFAMGGHSLSAARLVSRLRREGWPKLPLCAIFDRPNLKTLAAFLDECALGESGTPTLRPVPRAATMPLAPIQHRLWLVDRLAQAGNAYTMAASFEISGDLDPAALRSALNALVARHEILRTCYPEDNDGDPIAIIAPEMTLDIPLHDLTALPEAERETEAHRLAASHAARQFDLAAGPLVRAELIRLDARTWHMPIAMHHIIADGWSVGVFARDLAAAYRAACTGEAPDWRPLALQYADYAAWQHRLLTGASLEAVKDFWRDYLQGTPSVLTLPTDHPRPAIASTEGASLQLALPGDLAARIEHWARSRGATPFMALLTFFLVLLHEESASDDLVVGTDTAGRSAPELEELIGFFVNVVPLRSRIIPENSFNDLLDRTRRTTLDAFEHDILPFERIVEAAGTAKDRSRNPLVQHLFVMQNVPGGELHLDDCAIRQLSPAERHSKFDIALFVEPAQPSRAGSTEEAPMIADWVFATSLYDTETIRRLHARWITIMEKAMIDPDQTALAAPPRATVQQSLLAPRSAIPIVLSPSGPGIGPAIWARDNQELIEALLAKHGAILFRGFDLPDAQAFRAFAEAMEPGGLYGAYGDLPPNKEAEGLYNSTPYPEQEMILFHNESSHLNRWPRKQWFFAEETAASGGCTPIVDGREMLRRLPAEVGTQFERRGLQYVRTFTPHLDVSWRDFFRTDDRAVVSDRCAREGMDCRWLDDETLQTRLSAPAVIRHPLTGEKSFFNQVQLHHPYCLDPEIRTDLLEIAGIDRFPRNVLFGDGTPIPDELMAVIGATYDACATRFAWQRGDTLMVDNMLTAHARDPFEGKRRVLVAMAGLISRSALASEEKAG